MSAYLKKFSTIFSVVITVTLMVSSQVVMAQGNSAGKGNSNGKNKNIGVGNASNGIMGRVITDKGVVYTGDPLSISLQFPRGSELVVNGDVDAYVVIFAPAADDPSDDSESDSDSSSNEALTDAIVLPVNGQASEEETKLFELEAVDLSTISAGTYQLALILTVPGGDPLNINDWHNGLLGLVHIRGLTITDEAVDFDADGDGEVDDDADGDGFSDEEDNSESTDTSSTATDT
ncbi:MAG: hypothetical protein ACJAS2_000753 [Pseudohongiellaceae bacterium]|jgi:hypothetical protein